MVSYETASFRGPIWGYDPIAFGTTTRLSAILEEMIIDVARGEGIASPRTFSRARVERLVADLQSFPASYLKPRRRAELLHSFYLAKKRPGARCSSDARQRFFHTLFIPGSPAAHARLTTLWDHPSHRTGSAAHSRRAAARSMSGGVRHAQERPTSLDRAS